MAREQPQIQFGKTLQKLRVQQNLTQEALAEKADISRRQVQRLEAGLQGPNIDTLVRLRFALDCSWDELMHGINGDPYEGLR